MKEIWELIYPWLIAGIGGFVGAALLLPTKLGEALIKFQFDKSIETLKADYARELESFRSVSARELAKLNEQLNHIGDRSKRSNEREFDAITRVWNSFVDSFDRAEAAIVQYTEIPDLENFTLEEVESFLLTREFSKEQIEQVQKSKDKIRTYGQIVRWKYISVAYNKIIETRVALRKEIFVPASIADVFEAAIERAWVAVLTELTRFRNPKSGFSSDESAEFFKERSAIFSKVKEAVQNRLLRSDRSTEEK